MSGTRAPPPSPPEVGEEQVAVSQPSATPPSARMQQELLSLLQAGDEESPDSVSSSVAVDFISVLGEEPVPVGRQPSTSSGGMEHEPPPLLAGDEESTDSVDTEIMNISASAARSRAFSPQRLMSSPRVQLRRMQLQPFVKAGETKWTDPVSSSGEQRFGQMRPWSPQPSTSTADIMTHPDWQPYIEPIDVEDHIYARDLSVSTTPTGFWDSRPPSAQPTSSSADVQLSQMKSCAAATDAKSADFPDSEILLDVRNISVPWETMRPWSPQPSTSTASSMLELQLRPVNTEVTCRVSINPETAQNISAPLGPNSPSKRSEGMLLQSEIPLVSWDNDNTSPTTMGMTSSSDYSIDDWGYSTSPVQKKMRRWPPMQMTSLGERTPLEMQNLTEGEDTTPAYLDLSCGAQDLSVPRGEVRKRLWTPQPSAPAMTHMQPLIAAIDTKADAFSMSVVQNISALVEEKKPRPLSPQPSTSWAEPQQVMAFKEEGADAGSKITAQNISGPVGEGEAPAPSEPSSTTAATVEVEVPPETKPAEKNPDSVYAHVPHNISNIPQLRGLKAGRRHGRLRRLNTQNKMNEKYGPMMQYLGPMVAEESAKQQTQQILIASALDHFANTINQIADKYEGKTDTTGFTERLEEFKKRMEERTEKKRKRNPNPTEESLLRPPSPPKLSEEEINKRLREETEAAVEALLTGDRSKENPNRFAEIIKSFQEAFRPPSK